MHVYWLNAGLRLQPESESNEDEQVVQPESEPAGEQAREIDSVGRSGRLSARPSRRAAGGCPAARHLSPP